MTAHPRVSILLSVRNGMPFLPETIESVMAQTLEDWELVLIDNASTDGTVEWIREHLCDEPRVRFVANETNLGHSGGLNAGLEHCRGEWIARLDADDRARPERLERQLAFVDADPTIKTTSCLAYYIDAEGKRVGRTYHDLTTHAAFERYMQTHETIGILHPGALIEAATMRAIGGYRPAFDPANDIDLWSRISERGVVLVQPEYLMEYRVHGAASSQQHFWAARMKHEWSRVCTTARRAGRAEPSWDEFMTGWRARPLLVRLDSWRKITAKAMYREAALDWISHRRPAAVVKATYGAALQPRYVFARAYGQVLRRTSHDRSASRPQPSTTRSAAREPRVTRDWGTPRSNENFAVLPSRSTCTRGGSSPSDE